MAIDIENPGADEARLQSALISLVGGAIDLNGASMVHFPSNAYLKKADALSGASNGRKGTFSCLFNDCGWSDLRANDPSIAFDFVGNASVFDIATGFGCGLGISVTANLSTPVINLYLADDTGVHITLQKFYPTNWLPGQPNHILLTWDFSNPPVTWAGLVNGMDCYTAAGILAAGSGDFDYSGSGDPGTPGFYGCGSATTGGGADYGNVFLDVINALSITKGRISSTDAQKFINGRQIQSLGSDGSVPFGVAPAIFLRGNAASIVTNRGSGGAFTLTGSLSDV